MEKIRIKISSLIDETPWLFTGEGTKNIIANKTILKARENIQGEEILHRIEFEEDCVKISRFSENTSHLAFYPHDSGDIFISTPFGDISGNTVTHKLAIKKTSNGTHITLSYTTSFDAPDSSVKKINISFCEI